MIHPTPPRTMTPLSHPAPRLWITTLVLLAMLGVDSAWAVPMMDDPKGFRDVPWGSALASRQDVEPIRSSAHIVEYVPKADPLSFADTHMTSILYLSVDDQFARVTIRYQGSDTHKQVLNFLETRFGRLDRIPGQMARGLTQQYTWRGSDTEINLTYQAGTERGYIFFDSRTLAPRFNDDITDSAD
ncbi:MAG: hypothetical protein OEV53_05745 [Nitrospira sp.]|nr:hypothetical protein [Nitrospira sp.]